MNRPIRLGIVIILLGFSSCIKEEQPMSKQEMNQKIDSILKTRIQESDDHARRDLEHRMKIEVRAKVDSIVKARQLQAASDTAIKTKASLK